MKIAFFGTPDFAVPTLKKIVEYGHTVEVFTQPDRPVGRKAVLTPCAVKQEALRLGIPVHQFEKIRSKEGNDALISFAPDLFAVVAFGQLFSEENLSVPPLGAINVHGSLLPKYRGASPVQQTVIDGCKEAGVSTMKLVKRMDAGDILLTRSVSLGENETFGELFDRLSAIGADLFMDTLFQLERGKLQPVRQKEEDATYCTVLTRDSGRIDFSRSAREVHNLIRGTNPWPGAFALFNEDKIKIWSSRISGFSSENLPIDSCPGTVVTLGKNELFVKCIDAYIKVEELQMPGGKRMYTPDFLRGHSLNGAILT